MALALVVAYIGWKAPFLLAQRRLRRRQELFATQLVDLTVALANGLRAGGALNQTLSHVARDLRGVVGEEIGVLLHEHRLGVDFAECFDRLAKRMPSEDMNLLSTALKRTLTSGGSLAGGRDKMTGTIRERKEFQERLKTMTAQGRFEAFAMGAAPLAAFGALYLIDRSLVEPLYTTQAGWIAMGVVVCLEAVGFYVINKIVTIEV